jgi:hypothetical protein
MLEFYPNAETVSSVVARFERFADCCNQAISLIEKVDLDRHWRDGRWRDARWRLARSCSLLIFFAFIARIQIQKQKER